MFSLEHIHGNIHGWLNAHFSPTMALLRICDGRSVAITLFAMLDWVWS